MSKNMVEPERTQNMWHLHVACCICKATRAPAQALARATPPPTHTHTHKHTFFLIVLAFAFCPYRTTQKNTSIQDPTGIRNRNPSKRSAAELRLKQLGYWDRRDSIPGPSRASRVSIPTTLRRLGLPEFLDN
jgi:hypothetical protein